MHHFQAKKKAAVSTIVQSMESAVKAPTKPPLVKMVTTQAGGMYSKLTFSNWLAKAGGTER